MPSPARGEGNVTATALNLRAYVRASLLKHHGPLAGLLGPAREQAVIGPARPNARMLQQLLDRVQRPHLDPIGADERQGRNRNLRQDSCKGTWADEAGAAR